MTCRTLVQGNGVTVIACTRGRERRLCSVCKSRAMSKLCDFPLRGERAGATCDRDLCDRCAVHVGPNRDLCPVHARLEKKEEEAMARKKEQRDSPRARSLVDYLIMICERPSVELQEILRRNQNDGDGSFTPESWEKLRDALEGLERFFEKGRRKKED